MRKKKPRPAEAEPKVARPPAPVRRRPVLRVLLGVGLLLLIGVGGWWLSVELRARSHRRQADEALAKRDFRGAGEHLDRYLQLRPSDREVLVLAVQTARRSGDADATRRLLAAASRANADSETLAWERQLLDIQSGELGDADAHLRYCTAHPDEPRSILLLEALITGCLQFQALDLDRARRGIELWLARRSAAVEQAQGFVWRGELAIRGGDDQGAQIEWRRALAIDPNCDPAQRKLADVLIRYAPREALDHILAVRARTPKDREGRLLLARCRRALGEHEEARQLLDELLADNAEDIDAILERGHVALDLHQTAEAERWFRQAEQMAPFLREPNVGLARCLQQAGRQDEARVYQQRVADFDAQVQRRIKEKKPGF